MRAKPQSKRTRRQCLSLDTRDPKISRPRVPITDERDTTPDRLTDALAFKRLVSNLASRLANTPASRMDETIAQGLVQVAEALDLDECALWNREAGGDDLIASRRWSRGPIPAAPTLVSMRESLPSLHAGLRADGAQWIDSPEDLTDSRDRDVLRQREVRAFALLPIDAGGQLIGAVSFVSINEGRGWEPVTRVRLRLVSSLLALALAPRQQGSEAGSSTPAPSRSHEAGASDRVELRREVPSRTRRWHVADESRTAREALAQVDSVAPTQATVLLTGETGTGKEVFAEAIHDRSPRRGGPLVRVNCAAIPAALIESELFGRERGAYTGALSRQVGRFELADGGTLFLDEIGDLPLESQVKLLRAIQERVVERLGGTHSIHVDVRLIAATNRDLEAAVQARTFREDLYYRLNVFPIVVPPLRERLEDIPVLVWSFIEEFAHASGKRIDSVTPESLAALRRHDWPGNVRELRNLVERAVILAKGPRLVVEPPQGTLAHRDVRGTLADVEIGHIRQVLEQAGWRVRGAGGAAERLGMKPTTLDSRMAKLGIRRPSAEK